MSVWAIVVAAGSGLRFGRPKQFEQVRGRSVLGRSVDAARSRCDGIVVVLPPDHPLPEDVSAERTAPGGATRSASVRSGLAEVPVDATVIVVHDAARPLASTALFAAVVDAVLDGADAVVPAVPLGDSIRRVGGEAVDRRDLVAVQTPQGFAAAVLRRAHAGDGEASDDATLAEAAGARVSVVAGEPTNVKLTHPADLRVAEALLDDASEPSPSPRRPRRLRAGGADAAELRIGHGVDVHPFSADAGPPPGAGRGPLRRGGRAGRSQRRRRRRPRDHRRAAGRGRPGRHRAAVPRRRPPPGGRRQRRAAPPRGRAGPRGGLGAGQRRLHGHDRGAPVGAPACRRWSGGSATWSARR